MQNQILLNDLLDWIREQRDCLALDSLDYEQRFRVSGYSDCLNELQFFITQPAHDADDHEFSVHDIDTGNALFSVFCSYVEQKLHRIYFFKSGSCILDLNQDDYFIQRICPCDNWPDQEDLPFTS